MSDVKKLLRDEAEHAEQNKDASPTSDTTVAGLGVSARRSSLSG